jgi:hypothetical protein
LNGSQCFERSLRCTTGHLRVEIGEVASDGLLGRVATESQGISNELSSTRLHGSRKACSLGLRGGESRASQSKSRENLGEVHVVVVLESVVVELGGYPLKTLRCLLIWILQAAILVNRSSE